MGDEVAFLPAVKHKSLLQVLSITTQNHKIAISFQYLKENVKDEVDFLPADKQNFLETDTIILSVCGQACPNYLK